jgi:uncharacterized protein with FMN-binding domain
VKYIKQILLGLAVVIIFIAYAVYSRIGSNAGTPVVPSVPVATGSTATTSVVVTPAPAVSVFKDGTYTGKVADAFYGNLQVAAIIQAGKLTDVQFLQFPNDRGESTQVNVRSNPILKSEAIQSQSANVAIVSGATQSSEAFQLSLADALAQAKN